MRKILVTGSNGFLGLNLVTHLKERSDVVVLEFASGGSLQSLADLVSEADAIFHFAGKNRANNSDDFIDINVGLTREVCKFIGNSKRSIPLIFSSSSQAELDNPYGVSKFLAEQLLKEFSLETNNPIAIFRFPGIFGKWSKPNYNSVVSTFCYNISRDIPIEIRDSSRVLYLTYVDDVIGDLMTTLDQMQDGFQWGVLSAVHQISVDNLAKKLIEFKRSRESLLIEGVGAGLDRALYSTYISYLPSEQFQYSLPQYCDDRGSFVEILKTVDSGQFSFFTINPGVVRGSHYHHSKTEKFLLVKGFARLRFRSLLSGETCEFILSSGEVRVVDSIPGWVHDITNIGEDEAIIFIWANEVFDLKRPDCIPCDV
jgi:UDP-2-acetamido-2,6-beta-L-arabino-hexul-4-ose reductase